MDVCTVTNRIPSFDPPLDCQVAAFLSTKQLVPEITKAYARAQSLGITGVPFTVIDGKYGVSGAQESETFAQVSLFTSYRTHRHIMIDSTFDLLDH